MTPAARVQSAIVILDVILQGNPTEQSLIRWARGNRFAGSKDRAAIRDLVYDAIRCRRSYATLGGGLTGRGLMIGAMRAKGADLSLVFNGERYAPEPLDISEANPDIDLDTLQLAEKADLPDWLWQKFKTSLGDQAEENAKCLRERAKVFVRVNLLKSDIANARSALATDGIETITHPLSSTALELTANQRRLSQSSAYQWGLVEIQDAASQAVCDFLNVPGEGRILDYCAGGGGKSLAIAAKTNARVVAHDANPKRMADIPARMKKAGKGIEIAQKIGSNSSFDLVFCDVPCSGSGSWRRDPEGKWALTPERLSELTEIQASILKKCAKLVAPSAELAYATCSVLSEENHEQIQRFLSANPEWHLIAERQFLPTEGADGFYVARLTRA